MNRGNVVYLGIGALALLGITVAGAAQFKVTVESPGGGTTFIDCDAVETA